MLATYNSNNNKKTAEGDNCQNVEELTAVSLITAIRAPPSPSITSKGGGDTLAIATSKRSGAAT